MGTGYVRLHRQMLDNPLSKKPAYAWLWIVLLLLANHKKNKFMWNGEIIIIQEGQIITGRKELSLKTGIPESTIEDILKFLERQHQIQQQKTTKYRLITIVNWCKYQFSDNTSDNKATTKQQQADTNKNYNNYNNEKKEEESENKNFPLPSYFDSFWKEYPKKEMKKKSMEIWKRKKLDRKITEILAFIAKAKGTDRWQKNFIKSPTTFLNNESWEDDIESYGGSKNDKNTNLLKPEKGKYENIK